MTTASSAASTTCHTAVSLSSCSTTELTVTRTAATIAELVRKADSNSANADAGSAPSSTAVANRPVAAASAATTPGCPRNPGTAEPITELSSSATVGLASTSSTTPPMIGPTATASGPPPRAVAMLAATC